MSQSITFIKGTFSKDFAGRLTDYYRFADPDGRYAQGKLRHWEGDGVVLYEARKESRPVGWVVYRPDSSTIEEIILRKDVTAREGLEGAIVDALIEQESLVSAEILAEDVKKYRWMLDYGFRPTRRFQKDGSSLVKMDLSIAVYLRKIKGKRPAKTYPHVEKVVVEKVPAAQSHEDLKASPAGSTSMRALPSPIRGHARRPARRNQGPCRHTAHPSVASQATRPLSQRSGRPLTSSSRLEAACTW